MFLKPIMLAGLGAVVLPLVLHLLSKARYRTVAWGGMMFLDAGETRDHQSTRLKQAILLMLRISIIALLAIAFARPVLRSSSAGGGLSSADDARIHSLIVLDRSASMGVEVNGRSRMADAKQAVVNILSTLQRGDEVSLILTGEAVDPGQAQPTTDLQSVAARVSSLSPSLASSDIASALEQVRLLLAREPNASHELYIVCDRQAVGWNNVNATLEEQWRKTTSALTVPLRSFVIPIGGDEADNIAIESINLLSPPIVRDIPAQVEVRLRNIGGIPRSNLPLTILANGKEIASATVNVAPNSIGSATSWVKLPNAGSQVLSARIDTSGFRADDRIDKAIDVLEPARVRIISGEARSTGTTTSVDYLRMALSPNALAGQSGVDPAVIRETGVDEWWGLSSDRDDVIVLSNVATITQEQISQLEQFLYLGGGLIFAPGDLTDIDAGNLDLYRDGEGFWPAAFRAGAAEMAPTGLGTLDSNHPIFGFAKSTAIQSDVTISRMIDVEDLAADVTTIARCADGRPFLIERSYGRGKVLMLTTSLSPRWNTLPTSTMFLPMMQSAVRYLAGANLPDRNLKPQEPIELTFDQSSSDAVAMVTIPGGQQRRVPFVRSGQRWTLRFTDTNRPGTYIVSLRDQRTFNYVVQALPGESDIAPLTPQRWKWLEEQLELQRVEGDSAQIARLVVSQRMGREVHLPLIGLVVLMALAEMVLSRVWSSLI